MNKICWNSTSYLFDEKPNFLLSGEFHYFRVPKHDWRRRLELYKRANGNCIATYVPWVVHEPVEGEFKFGDVPERDLEEFLSLCQELGLYVLCRPGPYQYSEMYYGGLPEWLCKNYPQLLAKNVKGESFHESSISYLHPLFLEKAKAWYSVVCPILAKYTTTNGGPVAMVQVDNELIGFHDWFGSWDYNVETMGIGLEGGRYPIYLEKKYSNIDLLNKAYNMNFDTFIDVRPLDTKDWTNEFESRRLKDYQDFYFGTIAEYVCILKSWLSDSGIDVGVVHNSANPNMNSYFKETCQKAGNDFLLGSDHYYALGPDWDQNNPTPQYAVKVFYSIEMLRLMGYPPTVFEMPSGSTSDWPPINADDVRCCYFMHAALGMKGLNYFIFTGGNTNPLNISYKTNYDYAGPISGDGKIRPHYYALKEFNTFLQENLWLANAELVPDFYIGLDWEHTRSALHFNKNGKYQMSNMTAWEFIRKGIIISAMNCSYIPQFVDLYSDTFLSSVKKPLIISTSVCMAQEVQERLIRFARNGGRLVLMPVIPYLDENFNPCTLIKDFLEGVEMGERAPFASVSHWIGDLNIRDISYIPCKTKPQKAIRLAFEEVNGEETGWKLKLENGGQIIWLGYDWHHRYFEHSRIMEIILGECDCNRPNTMCDNPNIWAILRTDGNRKMLFIMNLYSSKMEANIQVQMNDTTYKDLGHFKLSPMEVRTVEIDG